MKRQEITRQLAAYFLSLQPGDNIVSIRFLAASLQASIGLISENISLLEETGAINIERHGKLGSFLINQSAGKLWKAAVNEPLVIAHTLPSNRRYEGLAGAMKQALNLIGIEAYFTFIRGSCTRLKALRGSRCHIAIMSQFAAEGMETKTETLAAVLPAGSFVKSHQVFFQTSLKNKQSAINVAIDQDSYDQTEISKVEFAQQTVNYKQITFMNIHHYLIEEQVDYAIWTEEDMSAQLGPHIGMRPLSKTTEKLLDGRNTKAALVVRTEDKATYHLIKKVLKSSEISRYQQDVIAGTKMPEY